MFIKAKSSSISQMAASSFQALSPSSSKPRNIVISMASSLPLPVPSRCPNYLPLPGFSVHTPSDIVHCSLLFPATQSFLISQRWPCFITVTLSSPLAIAHTAGGIFQKLVTSFLQFKDSVRCPGHSSVKPKATFPNS